MGRFIVSRSAAGDRFSLRSESGRILAVSRDYATLDACKKGITSVIVNAPTIPVLDATAGEYGKNPKFEIVAEGTGFAFLMKSANGKSVLSSPAYATKKACLRAISMLRRGVSEYEILFYTKEGLTPLSMKPPQGTLAKPASPKPVLLPKEDKPSVAEPIEAEAFFDEAEEPPCIEQEAAPVTSALPKEEPPKPTPPPPKPTAAPPTAPRLIRLDKAPTAAQKPTGKRASPKPTTARGLLGKLFKKYK